jgi:hypothetical protein
MSPSMKSPRSDSDHSGGYGQPPVSGRWKPGQSGNPKGRKKSSKTVGQSIDETLTRKVTVEEDGRRLTLTLQELIIRNLVHAAARRDTKAIHALFALKARYQDSKETLLDPTDLDMEDRKIIEEHLAKLRASSDGTDTQKSDDETDQNTNEDKSANDETDGKPEGNDGST